MKWKSGNRFVPMLAISIVFLGFFSAVWPCAPSANSGGAGNPQAKADFDGRLLLAQNEAEGSTAGDDPAGGASGTGSAEIREIRIEGVTVMDVDELQEAVSPFTGRPLTFEEMQTVTELIGAEYSKAGYILAKAYLPKQEIRDGVLRVVVYEGRLGEIEVPEKKYYSPRVLRRFFTPMVGEIVRDEDFEKGLYLSKDIPGADMTVAYKRGDEPGTVDLVLDSDDRFLDAIKAGLDYNNFGPEVVSENRFGAFVEATEPLWGSTWKVRGVVGEEPENSTMFAANATVPLFGWGTRLNASALVGDYVLGANLAEIGLEGESEIYGVSLSHPVFRKPTLGLDLEFGYDYKYTKTYALDFERSIDEVDVFYASISYDSMDRFFGKNIASLAYEFGEITPDDTVPTSRFEGAEEFQRLTLDFARLQKVPYFDYTTLLLRFYGQYSPDRLPPVEQIVMGGYGTVRGHEPSVLLGDYGVNLSAELLLPPPFVKEKEIFGRKLAEMFQFAFFCDYGKVYLQDPIPGETDSEDISGYGAGIRMYYDKFRFKMDFGLPVDKRDDPEAESSYLYFWVSYDIL